MTNANTRIFDIEKCHFCKPNEKYLLDIVLEAKLQPHESFRNRIKTTEVEAMLDIEANTSSETRFKLTLFHMKLFNPLGK